MFSEQRRREEQASLAHDYALECAEAKGIERGLAEGIEQGLERGRAEGIEQGLERGLEQGLERGKVEGSLAMLANLVRQGILTPEVASQQLGMTVAEFEALLQNHHQQ